MAKESRWIWCDLEMTGLDTSKNHIIEIATIITDDQLNVIAEGPQLVIHQSEERLKDLDPWIIKHHGASGLLESVRNSQVSELEAMQATLAFIKAHVKENQAPLCGNSIGTDRAFLSAHMPEIETYCHYRNIDVSSIKLLYEAWYPERERFSKSNQHRALDDIKESIAELSYYRREMFSPAKS